MAAPSMFDFLAALNQTKKNLLQTDDPEVKKAYPAFIIRRGLAQSTDTLVCAQRMNRLHHVDDWMQWNFALHTIAPKKRYNQWSKKGALDPNIELVSGYYYISVEKASEYLKFLTPAQLEHLKLEVARRDNPVGKPTKTK